MCAYTSFVSAQRTVTSNGHRNLPASIRIPICCLLISLSGYGLYASYISKGKPYINSFLKRKIAPFYWLILLFTVIYLVKGILLGQTFSIEILLKSLTFGGTIISLCSFGYSVCFCSRSRFASDYKKDIFNRKRTLKKLMREARYEHIDYR